MQRSDIRQETVTCPGQATQISNVADFNATLHLSEHFRIVDTFRFWSYRIPESFSSIETDWTCINIQRVPCSLQSVEPHRAQPTPPANCHSTRVGKETRSISCGTPRSTLAAASDSDMATRSFITSSTSRLETRTEWSSTSTRPCSHSGQDLRRICVSTSTGNIPTTTMRSCASDRARNPVTASKTIARCFHQSLASFERRRFD